MRHTINILPLQTFALEPPFGLKKCANIVQVNKIRCFWANKQYYIGNDQILVIEDLYSLYCVLRIYVGGKCTINRVFNFTYNNAGVGFKAVDLCEGMILHFFTDDSKEFIIDLVNNIVDCLGYPPAPEGNECAHEYIDAPECVVTHEEPKKEQVEIINLEELDIYTDPDIIALSEMAAD